MPALDARLAHLAPAEWAVLDAAVAQLEQAWHGPEAPQGVRPFLPESTDAGRKTILVELIRVDQEHRWRRGEPRPVEAYLAEWPELAGDAAVLAELVASECLTRIACGDSLTEAELQQRFPDVAGRIELAAIVAEVRAEERARQHGRRGLSPGSTGRRTPGSMQSEEVLFDRYELRGELGAGNMGVVCRVYDQLLGREVALKIPSLSGLLDDADSQPQPGLPEPADSTLLQASAARSVATAAIVSRFLREAKAAAGIDHPNVARIFDFGGLEHGVPYFTMQLIEGTRLDRWIKDNGPADPLHAARIVAQLADGLAELHAHGIIHRDVKAANVVLARDGKPVLTDFSLARLVGGARESQSEVAEPWAGGPDAAVLSSPGMIAGTPAYMSPEQATGAPADERSDIYSLGVVLYHLLTGELPFRGSATAVLEALERGQPPPRPSALRPGLDPRLEAICLKAMARRAEERFVSAAEFRAALDSILASNDARAPARFRDRRAAIACGLAAACLVLAVGALFVPRRGASTASIADHGQPSDFQRQYPVADEVRPPEAYHFQW